MHRNVYIKTTEACQLSCAHCFTGGNSPVRKFLDVEKTRDWIGRFTDYIPKDDQVHFELHGGEPFLAPMYMLKQLTSAVRNWGPVGASIGATTNLVYLLTDELLWFIKSDLNSIGTSWDKSIRFANEKQESLWASNVKKLVQSGVQVTLNVSVTKSVVDMDQQELLKFLRDTGCYRVQFERITLNGNANQHPHLFPSNAEINDWYLRLHDASEKLNARGWFYNAALENVYDKFEKGFTCSGTFCRTCEESIFTINADGSIAGCPNSAPEEAYGHIDWPIRTLFDSPKRLDTIVEEAQRASHCWQCPVAQYCGGDCHRLSWEGDVCAAPRQLMKKLAGLDYQEPKQQGKRIIPIKRI